MITISVCMIVKNEEKVLKRCLDSLAGLADEIILVDTGSSDRTKEIAESYGCKVFDFEWVDDFSAARNFSFSKAIMDYIYVADADEVIDEINRERFFKLKQCLLPEVDIVQMLYTNQLEFNTTYNFNAEYRPKLFKRLRQFTWTDPIHETVMLDPVIYDSEIEILHMPENNHAVRDFGIFQRLIQRGISFSDKLIGMYARELFIAGKDEDFLMAEPFFESLLKQEISESRMKLIQCILVRCGRIKNDSELILKYGLKNIASGKASAEVCYEVGEYFYNQADINEAVIWYMNAAFETEAELNIHYSKDFPLERIASCYEMAGNIKEAHDYRRQAAKLRDSLI
ncbi:glycosyltransferase family 2 protein [Anaerocolumna xylanovorans]|uniref:Glycosyltransferase involved in cell wall bisynthesis n=1 Tax=Anaerocolumna xylanovorans DSM 12503 TaxID=1121345 RepID=A0A1M7Y859_9FIRM|nr:glycosyltransferase family 2 protein [Anaerocolumna xylanovorans]SHO48807.1 Glycosyltransferase involved in cell wall bisynthesis [Anaerocolumna xylanovorans DSM 12503]